VVGALVSALRSRWEDRQRRELLRAATREACDVLVSELHAGQSATRALEQAATVLPALAPVAAVSRMGGDTSAALRAAADTGGPVGLAGGAQMAAIDGPRFLARLAAAWAVAEMSGAGLTVVLRRVAWSLRVEEEVRREVANQLAGPRASARILAALPLMGWALGSAAGFDPLGFLLGSPAGWACATAAVALSVTGLVWVERLAASAERIR
jgi:tight adherence protein B